MQEPSTISDQASDEITRLFNFYRIARLNVRYYGHRAESLAQRQRYALVVIAVLSALALSILLAEPPQSLKIIAMVSASIAAVSAAVLPTMGWSENMRDLHFLYVSYGILFGQIESLIGRSSNGGCEPQSKKESAQLTDAASALPALWSRSHLAAPVVDTS
jgi:hypothetical protein